MFPIVTIPEAIRKGLSAYRSIFCRTVGFEHICRFVTGLINSPNKTLQGIYGLQVWPEGESVSRRAMHEAVPEAGWQSEELMPRHRQVVSEHYRADASSAVISLDWTLMHHDWGRKIYGIRKGYDYVRKCHGWFQTVLTVTVSDAQRLDGILVDVQHPEDLKQEKACLNATARTAYATTEDAHHRLLELLHYDLHQRRYRKITGMASEAVQCLEEEGLFPDAHYTFDNGVLNLPLCQFIESKNRHWVSELEISRHVRWKDCWCRIDVVAEELKQTSPGSFRQLTCETRVGKQRTVWAFSKTLRLKRYGKKRILIVHEKCDLSDSPRFLITDALEWEGKRILNTWSYRWSSELLHEFSKQETDFESAQPRNEEAVKRHLRSSCVAHPILQDPVVPVSTSGRFGFAQGQTTFGQRTHTLARQVFQDILIHAQQAFNSGKTTFEVLDMLMPA